MKHGHWLSNPYRTIGLLFTLGATMTANAGILGGNTMTWKEEVLLHDGQIIVAERFYNLGGRPTLDSRERAARDEGMNDSQNPQPSKDQNSKKLFHGFSP